MSNEMQEIKLLLKKVEEKSKKLEEKLEKAEKKQKNEGTLTKIVKEMKGASSDQIGITALFHMMDNQRSAMYESLDYSREAQMLHATRGGNLGTLGNKEAGIPRGMPLKLENYEAYNKVQMAVWMIAQDLRMLRKARDWIDLNKEKRRKAKILFSEMQEEKDLDKRDIMRDAFHTAMLDAYQDKFDFDNIEMSDEWIRKESPTLWSVLQRAMIIYLGRTFTLEELAFLMEATGAVVKPSRMKDRRADPDLIEAYKLATGEE